MSSQSPLEGQSEVRRVESAPLLNGEEHANQYLTYGTVESGCETLEEDPSVKKAATPLPLKQILLLSLMRISAPLAYYQIFPYINQMVQDLGVADDSSQIGYYSGLVDSTFSSCQLFTCLKVGMLADRIGRKPILLIGISSTVICTTLFGFSTSLAWAIITQAVAGAMSGNSMIINSAVGDITDETNQVQAYAWIGLAYNLASTFGPAIGGSLAKPEVTFPNSFGTVRLFQEFPYLLPCITTGMVSFIALACCALFFKETATPRRPVLKPMASCYSSQDVGLQVLSARDFSAWQLALDPLLFSIFRSFFLLNITNSGTSVVFSLFAYTPIEQGGLSRDPTEIGFAMALSGVISGLVEVLFLARLQRRFGSLTLLRGMMSLWPIVLLMFPITHFVARATIGVPDEHTSSPTEGALSDIALWASISVLLLLQRCATMAFPVNLILTRNAVPSDDVLGTVFGLSQLVGTSARGMAPAFVSSLFAFSKEHVVLGGNLVWLVMIAISLLGLWATTKIRDGRDEDHYARLNGRMGEDEDGQT